MGTASDSLHARLAPLAIVFLCLVTIDTCSAVSRMLHGEASWDLLRLGPHLGILILHLHHVGGERMPIDLHQLCRRIELDPSLFNSRLDLPTEYPALTSIL